MAIPNIETIIRDRVKLTVDCLDGLCLTGDMPVVVTFADAGKTAVVHVERGQRQGHRRGRAPGAVHTRSH